MQLSIIVAMSENRVIGRDGDLPWRLSADLRRFKRLTMGHHIAMGRKTYESIGRPLPGRKMIIITRQQDYVAEGATVANSLDAAIAIAQDASDDELFIIGGGEIYRQAIERANRLYFTRVHTTIDGDTYFPEFNLENWQRIEQTDHLADEKNQFPHTFEIYQRVMA